MASFKNKTSGKVYSEDKYQEALNDGLIKAEDFEEVSTPKGVEVQGEMGEPMLTPSLKGIKFALQTLTFVKEVPMPEGLADVLTEKLKLDRAKVESYSLITFRLAEGKLVSISSGEFANWPDVRSGKSLLPFKAAKSTTEGYSLTECVPL